jgi:hypothetical protein
MRFAFIAKHRSIWPVAWLCEALDVSRSGFHAWLKRTPSKRTRDDEEIGARCERASSAAPGPTARGVSGAMCWPKASLAASTGSSG